MLLPERFDKPLSLFTILTYFSLALKHLWLWLWPSADTMEALITLGTLMAFEFIMLHSGLFMFALSGSKKMLVGLFFFYGLFALIFNLAMPHNEIIYLYMFVVISRVKILFFEEKEELKQDLLIYSFVRTMIYFVLVITITLLGEKIPEMGLTTQFLSDNNYRSFTGNTSGVFVDFPQVPMCLGFVYFTLLGLLDTKKLLSKSKTAPESANLPENQ